MADEPENGSGRSSDPQNTARDRIKALRAKRMPDLARSEDADATPPVLPHPAVTPPRPAGGSVIEAAGGAGDLPKRVAPLPNAPTPPISQNVAQAADRPRGPAAGDASRNTGERASLVRSMIARIEQSEAAKSGSPPTPSKTALPPRPGTAVPRAPGAEGLMTRAGQRLDAQPRPVQRAAEPVKSAPSPQMVRPPEQGASEHRRAQPRAMDGSPASPVQTAPRVEAQSEAAAFNAGFDAQAGADTADALAIPEPSVLTPVENRAPYKAKPNRVAAKSTGMFAAFEWLIASRYLRARRKEGFISIIAGFSLVGVALGVATLIIVMSVMTGFRETLIEQILGGNPHMQVTSQSEKMRDFDDLSTRIGQVDGITMVWPSVEGQVLASSATGHTGVILRGVRQQDIRNLRIVTDPLESYGSLERFVEDRGIAIGQGVADELGLRLGDNMTLMTPDGDLTPFGVTPRSKSYPIVYIYRLGQNVFDSRFIYMPLQESQFFLNKKGEADAINITVDDPNNINEFKPPIRQAARRSVATYSWQDMQGGLIGALDLERNVMFLILALIILVAALNIISGLVMLVKDKAKDVAIMRTMGMSRASVMRIFFICGASIGVVGAVCGTILGVLFVLNIHPIENFVEWACSCTVFSADVYGLDTGGLPARLQWGDVIFTLCLALVLSFIATLYPAWKAAKLDPVEALRYE